MFGINAGLGARAVFLRCEETDGNDDEMGPDGPTDRCLRVKNVAKRRNYINVVPGSTAHLHERRGSRAAAERVRRGLAPLMPNQRPQTLRSFREQEEGTCWLCRVKVGALKKPHSTQRLNPIPLNPAGMPRRPLVSTSISVDGAARLVEGVRRTPESSAPGSRREPAAFVCNGLQSATAYRTFFRGQVI